MKYTKEQEQNIIEICNSSPSIRQASIKLKMNYKTLRTHAKRLNCFKTNQCGKGIVKNQDKRSYSLKDIFQGKHKGYSSFKLKNKTNTE